MLLDEKGRWQGYNEKWKPRDRAGPGCSTNLKIRTRNLG